MTIQTAIMTNRVSQRWQDKINPAWWLVGPDGWEVPTINNGQPYLPDVSNVWLRRFYWFICRNPLMNFVGYVIGVEDKNYSAIGSFPVLRTTGRDCKPQQLGWRWAVLTPPFSVLALIATIVWAALAWLLSPWIWIMVLFTFLRIKGPLPFISYWGSPFWLKPFTSQKLEFYFGWRPHSGGLGYKSVLAKEDASQQVLPA